MHYCYVVHSKYLGKREHQCGGDVVYVKTETKQFTQNEYELLFLEGHLSPFLLVSRTRAACLEKTCKINVSFKKTCLETLWQFFPIPLHLMFLNGKSTLVFGPLC